MLHKTKDEEGCKCVVVLSEVGWYAEEIIGDKKHTHIYFKRGGECFVKTDIEKFHVEMEKFFNIIK